MGGKIGLNLKKKFRWGITVVVLAVGWRYPLLAFMVPVVMLTGLVGAVRHKGRYPCGNVCPRGSFFDTWSRFFGGNRAYPQVFARQWFRWMVVIAVFAFMLIQAAADMGSLARWGTVFWQTCFITTLIGMALTMLYRSRAWCALCPMGTMQAAIAGNGGSYLVATDCTGCGVCEKSCPMGYEIVQHINNDGLSSSDCIQCETCIAACPANSLTRKINF